jgi:hypothetical protein
VVELDLVRGEAAGVLLLLRVAAKTWNGDPQNLVGRRRSRTAGLTCDYMVTYSELMSDDDRVFKALADPTRRFLLDRLFERDGRTLTELE